jgi:NDP-sugar pyrophosphorylase family protein
VTPADLDAWVLCGGSGTRLRSEIADRPKPLAPVDGRIFLDVVLAWLRSCGVEHFVLCAGFLAEAIEPALPGLRKHGRVSLSIEDEPLGTGGALLNALACGDSDPMLVLNGDSICPVDVRAMLDRHLAVGAGLTMAAAEAPSTADYGRLRVEPDGRVSAFDEKAPDAGGGLVNAGVYLVARSLFSKSAPSGRFSLETDLFPVLAREGRVHAWTHEGPFVDIGTPERYRDAPRRLREIGVL